MTTKVTLTIKLDLEMAGLPSQRALGAALERAEKAAARVFVNGDAGGKMKVEIEDSPNPVPKTCDVLTIRDGYMQATLGRLPKKAVKAVKARKP